MRRVCSLAGSIVALALAGCGGARHACVVVTTDPSGAEVRLGMDSRIVGTSPTDVLDVELPSDDATIVITVTKLDHTVGRKIITLARPHESQAAARADVQRFHFELQPAGR